MVELYLYSMYGLYLLTWWSSRYGGAVFVLCVWDVLVDMVEQ